MNFEDIIKQLVERINKMKDGILTEEATKTAFIMPFVQALGYDVFNPSEVCPEFTCDAGIKKGEKIDYAVMHNGEAAILIECKHCGQDLDVHNNQLMRYFNVSKAKFGVLTNGVIYRFFTDLDRINVMDAKPFFELDLSDIKDWQIEELRKFHKSRFDIPTIINTASSLKYTRELKHLINSEFNNPSQEFVKFFTRQVYDGMITAKVNAQFDSLLKSALVQWKNDFINDLMEIALNTVEQAVPGVNEAAPPARNQKSSRSALKVTTQDGRIIQNNRAYETLLEVVRYAGVDKVRALNLKHLGVHFVATSLSDQYGSSQHEVAPGQFVITHSSTQTKKRQIEAISGALNLNLKVEIV